MIRLLLYSHDPKLEVLLGSTLGEDFSLVLERRAERIKNAISQGLCDLVILDFDCAGYPGRQQLSCFDEIRDLGVPIVVMTDDDSRSMAMDLVQRGVSNFIRKPPVLPELRIVIRRAHELSVLKRELDSSRRQVPVSACGQLIGSGTRAQGVYDLIRRVAGLDAPVLITGETGTGKELIARSIHNGSSRRDRPFIAVSCGAIPETLIEGELFGAEKGAFTGAVSRRKGYLEEAGNGTLFFDEIGELSPQTQVKLLRVLQQREFSRLGTTQLVPLQARLLFATHRNLLEMVEEGTFRRDLYYRVNVISIEAPGLRDRAEDIPQLAQHFLEEYARLFQKPAVRITPEAMALLFGYEWPGNIRELENVIQSALIRTDDEAIKPEDLPETMRRPDIFLVDDHLTGVSFEERMQDYKIKLAHKAIQECNGNKTLAARSLNISRTYLHRLIRNPGEDENAMLASAPN